MSFPGSNWEVKAYKLTKLLFHLIRNFQHSVQIFEGYTQGVNQTILFSIGQIGSKQIFCTTHSTRLVSAFPPSTSIPQVKVCSFSLI